MSLSQRTTHQDEELLPLGRPGGGHVAPQALRGRRLRVAQGRRVRVPGCVEQLRQGAGVNRQAPPARPPSLPDSLAPGCGPLSVPARRFLPVDSLASPSKPRVANWISPTTTERPLPRISDPIRSLLISEACPSRISEAPPTILRQCYYFGARREAKGGRGVPRTRSARRRTPSGSRPGGGCPGSRPPGSSRTRRTRRRRSPAPGGGRPGGGTRTRAAASPRRRIRGSDESGGGRGGWMGSFEGGRGRRRGATSDDPSRPLRRQEAARRPTRTRALRRASRSIRRDSFPVAEVEPTGRRLPQDSVRARNRGNSLGNSRNSLVVCVRIADCRRVGASITTRTRGDDRVPASQRGTTVDGHASLEPGSP